MSNSNDGSKHSAERPLSGLPPSDSAVGEFVTASSAPKSTVGQPGTSSQSEEKESSSRNDSGADSLPEDDGDRTTSSRTVIYVPGASSPVGARQPADSSDLSATTGLPEVFPDASENAKTVISHRPVAAPEEFYRSMPLAELAEMLEGRQLDHFSVEQMIGGGGMGAVFRGRDLRLDRVVAIKVIPASKRDAETLRRFRLEAQAAARLDHPNIARVFYVGESEQWNYIVFEFIDGVNIRDLVEMEGPLTVDDAVYYTRQVAEALEHARQRDVVHRDIKPSNILVTAAGHIKVVDMGLARDTSMDKSTADATASGITLGTFDYISPEQARNPRDADVRSDLYSLGCSLFYMLTGNAPFPEGTALQKLLNHGSQPPPDPRGWRDDLSDQLYEVMVKLMAKRPSDRYQKPLDLINDLVLLAEMEELPRSQAPGTFLLSPSVAQRSLVETNLPWMVALAFLLGSTIWLQIVPLSAAYEFPWFKDSSQFPLSPSESVARDVDGAAAANAVDSDISPADSAGDGNEAVGGSTLPVSPDELRPPFSEATVGDATAIGSPYELLVVSVKKPDDVPLENWENSLARAIERYAAEREILEIEIRGRIVLDRPITFRSGSVRLRGSDEYPGMITFTPRLLATMADWDGLLQLSDTKLNCSQLSIDVEVPSDTPTGKIGVFDLKGASSVQLDNCVVSVLDIVRSDSVHVVLVGADPQVSRETTTTMDAREERIAGDARAEVIVRQSLIRGNTSFLRFQNLDLATRLEMTVDSSVIAVSGTSIAIRAPNGLDRSVRSMRLVCTNSRFLNERGFAEIEYTGEGSPQFGLQRTSQGCVYWSRPGVSHVSIRGAQRQSLLGTFNLLFLQGQQNSYDENIKEICQCYSGFSTVALFGFAEARASGWLTEGGNQSQVSWQSAIVPRLPLYEIDFDDVQVTGSRLPAPGVRRFTTPPL